MFTENHNELCDALWKDLRRNVTDTDLMDVAYCAKEADYALQHLTAWMEPQSAPMPLVFEPGHIRVRRDPLGVTLIIGAWNEPFDVRAIDSGSGRGKYGDTEAVGGRGVMRRRGGASGAQVLRSSGGRGGRWRRP
jgi:Aldehyde dehydrogenase family